MKKIGLVGLAVFCCLVGGLGAERKTTIPAWANVSKEQIAEAKKLGVPVAFANSAGVKFVLVPAGEFMMGSPDNEPGRYKEEGPQHKVKIPKAFYMSIHQTTQGQWKAAMGTTPWKGQRAAKDNPDHAANHMCWNDAVAFCAKLGAKDGRSYSLPTEAQWEYACRAGSTTRYCYGDDIGEKKLGEYAWYHETAMAKPDQRYVHPVGVKKPNAWGIHDMHGNVWELCMDVTHKNFEGAPADGSAWLKGGVPLNKGELPRRVLRGGGWRSTNRRVRTASRYSYPPALRSYYVGFRITCAVRQKVK
ncbi:MAG: formylglycine-generating enzyme family protein [Phycisphaerae bacterium]|jgi:formylglycine-generating enzyme required for sulfatase activity|nr:formylglycine-generating enzyme family protein [Phycisphaerae bacterium]